MTVVRKNPILVAARCYRVWRAFGRYPRVFTARDASKGLRFVLQPDRFYESEMRRFIRRELTVRNLPEGGHQIRINCRDLAFYWLGEISGGLGAHVLQEIDPAHPHYYTSPPVHLTPSSIVLDVGACDGLLALRLTRGRQVAKVICFEPGLRAARLLQQSARESNVAERIQVESLAVGKDSRDVFFTDLSSPEGNHVVTEERAGLMKIRQVSLDDYCRNHQIKLSPRDLIKVDAEGADVDVVQGAEQSIRGGAPQIAVTTYHDPSHAAMLIDFLRKVQPRYKLRLKGLMLHNTKNLPRPVLLQAAIPPGQQ